MASVTHKRRAKNPSFSSILLDSIYRSIDDDTNMDTTTSSHFYYDHHSVSSSSTTTNTTMTPSTTSTTTLPKTYNNTSNRYSSDIEYTLASKQRRNKMRSDCSGTLESAAVNLRHAIMIDSWMEHHQQPPHDHRNIRQKSSSTKPTTTTNPPKPRSSSTLSSLSSDSCFRFDNARDSNVPSSARERSSSRSSKSRDMLKKTKKETINTNQQPVSPGARIAAFLNSLFRNGSTMQTLSSSSSKREKVVLPPIITTSSASTSTSTCSSASSFSRSCLSKTPSSRGSSSSNITNNSKSKRSVRFYPVSVIVDEDLRPCGEKYLLKEQEEEVTKVPMMPREGNNKWKREKEIDKLMKMIKRNYNTNNDELNDDDSDDEMKDENESCASSDLFELDNLSGATGACDNVVGVGVSRFSEELPVYATTSLHHLSY